MNLDLVPIGAVSISLDGSLEAMHLPVIRTISSKLKDTIVLIIGTGKQQEITLIVANKNAVRI